MKIRFAVILFLALKTLVAQNVWVQHFEQQYRKAFEKKYFVDSLFSTLNEQERIGQLFMIAAYSTKDSAHFYQLDSLVKKYHVGGLIFFKGTPTPQALMTNYFQQKARVPLFIAVDGEWGLSMRLDSTIRFPKQLTLGAIQDNTLIYEMGKTIGKECKRLGVHINFAPVIDVNNNPKNPVINDRSFGEDKLNVAMKGLMYAKGMQDEGVMACAKHFPGHGDTDADSHYSLPVINKSLEQLEQLELYPFKVLFNEGVHSVMAAHLYIPAIDNTKDLATSLSKNSTTKLLKEQMGFKGLVFSDALNMKGVSKFFKPGEVEVKAFKAGNDVLLFAEDVPKAISLFKNALNKKEITQQQIDEAVKKILTAKYDYQLFHKSQQIPLENLIADLNNIQAQLLNRKLFESAITYVSNETPKLPLENILSNKIASVAIGDTADKVFQNTLNLFAEVKHFSIDKNKKPEAFATLKNQLQEFDEVIISMFDMSRHANKNYGLTDASIQFVNELAKEKNITLLIFGNPYSLKNFEAVQHIVCLYEDYDITRNYAAQFILGGVAAKGKLPVTASEKFRFNMGIATPENYRFKYTIPEEVGIASSALNKIDSIVNIAITEKMTPGCQVFFAKDGKVFYHKSFGQHTYQKNAELVNNHHLYDIASITKIAASTLALMKLYEEEKIALDNSLNTYLPNLKKYDVGEVKIKDILLHQSGLPAWIPFYNDFISPVSRSRWFRMYKTETYSEPVADSMFTKPTLKDAVYNTIYYTKVDKKPAYKYSDIGFYLFPQLVESTIAIDFEKYLQETFYQPLQLKTITYNPREKFSKNIIVPTEKDTVFRNQLIHGYVHDPGAAMIGGISGHAGLFANAHDVAILMQVLLNKGEYAGKRFFKPETVEYFTKTHIAYNRRGLGFDKPEPDTTKSNPTAKSASPETFGHSGFTGTCTWADPQNGLVYVFLSNRVHPSAQNNKLATQNIRTDIMQVVYDALKNNGK